MVAFCFTEVFSLFLICSNRKIYKLKIRGNLFKHQDVTSALNKDHDFLDDVFTKTNPA